MGSKYSGQLSLEKEKNHAALQTVCGYVEEDGIYKLLFTSTDK